MMKNAIWPSVSHAIRHIHKNYFVSWLDSGDVCFYHSVGSKSNLREPEFQSVSDSPVIGYCIHGLISAYAYFKEICAICT